MHEQSVSTRHVKWRWRNLTYFVSAAIRIVFLRHWHGEALLRNNRVGITINGRIYAYAEEMLVILSQSTSGYDVPPWAGLVGIDVDHTDNTCSSCLNRDSTGLVEFVRKNVLIVCERYLC
jgi:hypothetical protein